ncbi:MAG: helix-turn-helix domain-containing protein [Bacteroidales bacterium]|nr:helix-turn-helix domain-containing protein [Bacteroidales bacterium]MBQ9311518.1 helix-turn-helix domain-containing protein [Bacteroidales bacterium]
MIHIGQHIKSVLKAKNVTVTSLALRIGTTRTNMHKIFQKESIDILLLLRISKELNHDFFKDLSEEYMNFFKSH